MKPLRVYARCPTNSDCGVFYYRGFLPLAEAVAQGLIELRIQHFTWGEGQGEGTGKEIPFSIDEFTANALWADVVLFARNDTPDYLALIAYTRDELKKPTVVDFDDLVWHTRPYNPGYRSFHPNSPHLKLNTQTLLYLNGLCVSTKFLKDWYEEERKKIKATSNDIIDGYRDKLDFPIFIYPNSLNWEERDKVVEKGRNGKYPKKEGEIRIGWSGSASHYENIKQALPAIKRLLKENKNVTFWYTGLFGDLFDDTPKEILKRVFTTPFSKLRDYHKELYDLYFDIAIAPLTDCNFNRAKSNLRLLEYASCRYPVVCSPVEPYNSFKKEVLFAIEDDEWYNQLSNLIKNPNLRKELSQKLYKKAKSCYDVKKNCKCLVDNLRRLVK